MPYETKWEAGGDFTTWWGHSTSAELLHYLQRIQASPNFDSARYSLSDFTNCEGFSQANDEVEYVAALDGAGHKTNSKLKIAVVTDCADVIAMVENYKNSQLSPYPIRVFGTLAEARKWVE